MSLSNGQSNPYTPNRPIQMAQQVVVIDGMIGGGKGLISAIVGALPRVEMWVHKPQIEQICGLYSLGHISLDGASTLINTWADEEIYNQSMGRNVNCRPKDKSSIFQDARPLRYLRRLFAQGDAIAAERIVKEKPILNLMTHANTAYAAPIFKAFGERLTYIRFTRHPMTVYMLRHVARWATRWGSDNRNGMLLHKIKDGGMYTDSVPFAAAGLEIQYLQANPMDRAILLIDSWLRKGDEVIDNMKNDLSIEVIEIPFEHFVFEPMPYVHAIASALNVDIDKVTHSMIKRHKVPRSSLTDAPENKLYRSLGWEPPKKKKTISEEFAEARAFAKKTASKEGMIILDNLANHYEQRYDLIDKTQ